MIKKNTRIIFEDGLVESDELVGGIPLSKGDMVRVEKDGEEFKYEVIEKNIEIVFKDNDQIINIEYKLK